ncbi:unnamed protein product [Cladocopium goreaui]|uniref:Uncharacterized protein n=1 Tax=Cladocopium goreaui TaxID=2562237 RepID=A0A9P1FG43_9DINO|nr:unnamed protein product [Cladocopium goreaui]
MHDDFTKQLTERFAGLRDLFLLVTEIRLGLVLSSFSVATPPVAVWSLLLSISFANFHFGLDGADSVLSSGRVRGCAQKHYADKRKLVQRPPLSVEQVLTLEKIVLDPGRTDVDRIGAGTEIQVRYCLVRRALAFDQANLIEFKLLEAWSEKLMQSRLEDPAPGYARITMKQLELADRKLFCVLAEKTREGIKTTIKGRPLDLVFKECSESSEVLALLQPRQGTVSAEKVKEVRGNSAEPPTKRIKRETGKKGKGKGNSSAFVRIPHDLLKLNCVGEPAEVMHDDTTNSFSDTPAQENFSDVEKICHTGTEADRPYVFLELCAGSATLSAEVKRLGVEVLAFDHESNRHQSKCKVLCLDLSLPHAFERIVELVTKCNVLGVHMGPPCGTCSKARGIPMPDGSAGPQPLRDDNYLLGLPNLGFRDKQRVTAANNLYEKLGLLVETLEKKLTSFLSNRDEFGALSRFCQDVAPHEHESWGYDHVNKCFNTAKESMLNLTFGCYEKVELKAMEHVLWMLVTLARYMRHFGEIKFVLCDGTLLEGHVHPAWNKVAFGMEATCVDMKSAYKQLPLNPCEYHRTVVSLWDVNNRKAACFLMRTLPFGATASVHHFLRVSSFIHAVGLHAGLCWGAYFDDFPTLCNVANRRSTQSTALGIFELLGFKYNDEKLDPFDKVASMLGVELDLREIDNGLIKVQNKPARVTEVSECLNRILDSGVIEADSLPSYLGKLQFAEAQLWGRAGRIALADLREATLHKTGAFAVTEEAKEAIEVLLERFTTGRPRELKASEHA